MLLPTPSPLLIPAHPLQNLVFGISIFVFNAFTNFSGQYMYSDVYMTLFNVIFTAVRLAGPFDGEYAQSYPPSRSRVADWLTANKPPVHR